MRDIKFRVWCKENEQFIQFDGMGFLEDGSLWYVQEVDENEPPYFFIRPEMCGLILMQYTGLKDKNGVEIFEGDTVRVFDAKQINQLGRDGAYVDAYLDELDEVDFIVFKDGGFVLNRTGLDVSICQSIEEFTVIGNIHENPELLEVEE